MPNPITLADIRDAAARLAEADAELNLRATMQEVELEAAVSPIAAKHRPGLDAAAEERARAFDTLFRLVEASPSLFRKARSIKVNGVHGGFKKEEDTLDYDDEQSVIRRIRDLHPDLVSVLIRTQESLVIDALPGLTPEQRQQVGLRLVTGADRPFVTVGASDTDKIVKAILSGYMAAADEPKGKKGKIKIKSKETA